LRHWFKKLSKANKEQLFFTEDSLLRRADALLEASDFPPELELGGLQLPLSYRFAPGQNDDGITVTIPAGVLQSISATTQGQTQNLGSLTGKT
jgi:ATP-dependent helicase HrpA